MNADGCSRQPSILDKRPPVEIFLNFLSIDLGGLRASTLLAISSFRLDNNGAFG